MKKFEYVIGKSKTEKTTHDIYLQVKPKGKNFWDVVSETTEIEFNKSPDMFDEAISRYFEMKYEVRLLSIFMEQTKIITNILHE